MTPSEPRIGPAAKESSATSNTSRVAFACGTLLLSWLLMQAVHEFGHVCGGFATGGTIRRVVLVPWELSRTDLQENPRPLIVCWMGPIVGTALPSMVWLILLGVGSKFDYWFRFFAGFCLIANGAYLGVGAWTHDGDAGDLLRCSAPIWALNLFGVVTIVVGFLIWHRLGPSFGFGVGAQNISRRAALSCLAWLIFVIVIECVFA